MTVKFLINSDTDNNQTHAIFYHFNKLTYFTKKTNKLTKQFTFPQPPSLTQLHQIFQPFLIILMLIESVIIVDGREDLCIKFYHIRIKLPWRP